jgi:hypothetical protein
MVRSARELGHLLDTPATPTTNPPQGYHVPAVRHRDAFYQKIEDERARALGESK